MKRAALIVTSVKHCVSAHDTLRVQDTVAALRRAGWSVDVLTPSRNQILSATLDADVRVFTVPRLPFKGAMMFLRGMALVARRDYAVLHGFDEGAGIVRAVDRLIRKRFAYVAEIHHPQLVGKQTVARASAVIVPDAETLAGFEEPPPKARVSILPDPHAELADNALTAAEFGAAIEAIYTYVLRKRPEESK